MVYIDQFRDMIKAMYIQESVFSTLCSVRSVPHKKWSDEQMEKATTAVEHVGISLCQAVEMFGTPGSTLHDHVTGCIKHGALPGPSPYLAKEELIAFLIKCANIGYPHTRYQVMGIIQEIFKDKGIKAHILDGW